MLSESYPQTSTRSGTKKGLLQVCGAGPRYPTQAHELCHVGHVWHCTDQFLMMGAVNRRMDEWVKQENLNLNTVDVGDVDGSDPK